ncbi:MAG: MAPEG family protein [Pseudomonadota bacterium]
MLPITSVYTSVLALIFLAVSWRVIMFRRGNKVSLGDGDSKDLRQRIRAQGNFIEYTPLALILLACIELQGAPAIAIHILGLMLLIGRALHARAFWVHPMIMPFRFYGMLLTLLMILFSAVGLLLHAVF